ncbi:MAG: CBS and ACT domain-containing protein [Chloroflexota bacterium]|nr:CBS and ACT domain-containing protein [Chloroflexota bacterium]
MLVKQRMTAHPITITIDTPVSEALSFMRQNNIRRLPVLDKKGELAGMVSEKDLLYASPSPATSLSVYEVGYLLTKLKVKRIMTKEIITVAANDPIEEAARIMGDNKIGGLPVMEDGKMIGIITETDIFTTILEMLGAREQGLRLTIHAEDQPGLLNRITQAIAELGGDIIALGTFYGDDRSTVIAMIKVRGVMEAALLTAMDELGIQVEDLRNV